MAEKLKETGCGARHDGETCVMTATVVFAIVGSGTVLQRCDAHANDLREALRGYLRPDGWMEKPVEIPQIS